MTRFEKTPESTDAKAAPPARLDMPVRRFPIQTLPPHRNLAAGVFALVVGGVLVGSASTGLFSSFALLPADNLMSRLADGETVTTAALGAGELHRKNALALKQDSQIWIELGTIYFERARRLGPRHNGYGIFLDRCIDALRNGLARAPARPRAWTMLAQASLARHGANEAFGPILRAAIHAAPDDLRLLLIHVKLGLAAWGGLDAPTRKLVAQRFGLGLDTMPAAMARLAENNGMTDRVRQILANDPTRRQRFDAAVAILPGPISAR